MKKFLSLVLSLAMTLSLVTISASATDYDDLSDKGEIQYEEAVAVLNKLGIITGYEDGSFKPTGDLTRGAAAKIIVSLEIGADAASALTVTAAPYKDVPVTNTFAAVISYCKTQGYINGYTDGTFRPSAALSGYAFAKMLLGAVGYRGDIEGFTGSGWTMNVAKLGRQSGLFDDFATEFAGGPNVNRESACLLALNALKATEVEYTANGNNLNVNEQGNIVGASTNYTRDYITSRNDNINQNISKEKSGNDSSYYTLEYGEEHFADLKLTKDGSGTDDFGRPSNEWTYKNVKIGTYPVSADYSYHTEPDGDTNVDEVKDMNLDDFYFDKDTTLTVNGKDCTDDADFGIEVGKTTTTKNAKMFDHYTTDGVLVEIYLDDDNTDTIEAVVVVKTQMMQVSSVQSDKVTLKRIEDDEQDGEAVDGYMNVSTSVEDGDDGYEVLKDLKADDYVLIVPVLDSGSSYKVFSAAVPETVTGVITSYATKSSDTKVKSITVAGTTYKMSTMWTAEDGDLNASTILSKSQESTVYLDSYGFAIYVSDVQDSNNAIIIDEIYSSVVDGKIVKYAQGWSTDGGELSINLGTSPSYPGGLSESAMQGKTFEYVSSTSNSADYKLVAHATTWNKGDLVYQASSTVGDATRYVKASAWEATVGGESIQYASDVKFIFLSEDDGDITGVTVSEGVTKVGDSADTSKQYDLVYVLNDDGNKIVAVVVPNDDDAGNTENLMYIQKTTGYTSTDSKDRVALFTAYIDGEKLTNCQSNKDTVEPDSFYTYSKNDTTGVYTISKYTKDTGKNTSVKMGDELSSDDLTAYNDYTFKSSAEVDKVSNAVLNAKTATVIDLDTDDDYTFTTVKEMKDAIKNQTIDAKTGKPITGFKVSYVFNGSDNTGSGKIAYLFITDTKSDGTTTPGGDTSGTADVKYENIAVLGNGKISYTQTITRPEYYAANTTVKVNADLYVDGAYYGPLAEESFTGTATTVNKVYGAVGEFTGVSKVEMKNITITPAEVNVRFIDGDTGNTLTRVTTPDASKTVTTDSTQAINFTVNTSDDGTTLQYAVSGVVVPSGVTLDKHTVEAANNALQTVTNSAGTATTAWAAKGDSYVTITVYGLKALESTEKFDITSNVADLAVTPTNFTGGVTGETAELTVTGTPDDSISSGQNALVKIQLSTAPAAAYQYEVTLKINGQTITHVVGASSVDFLVTNVTSNLEINKADITVKATANLMVTSATWTGTTVTLTFNQNVDKTTGEDISSTAYTWADGSAGNSSTLGQATVSGNTVTLTFAGNNLLADNTITLDSSIQSAAIAGNTSSAQVIKLVTGGTTTITNP